MQRKVLTLNELIRLVLPDVDADTDVEILVRDPDHPRQRSFALAAFGSELVFEWEDAEARPPGEVVPIWRRR